MQPNGIARDWIARVARKLHALGERFVGDDLAVVERHAPGLEQLRQVRHGGSAGARVEAAAGLRQLRIGIDEDERASAAEHELVDGIKLRRAQICRMYDHENSE